MGGGPARYSGKQAERDDEEDDSSSCGVTARTSDSDPEMVKVTRRSDHSEETGSLLVYAKSKVYTHPSSYSRDNVPGWITVVRRGSVRASATSSTEKRKRDYLISWIPESLLKDADKNKFVRVELDGDTGTVSTSLEEDLSLDLSASVAARPAQSFKNHAWSIPLSSIYSLLVTPPTLANWYGSIQINLSEAFLQSSSNEQGHVRNLPTLPLYFHDDESPSTMLMMDRRSQALRSGTTTTTGGLPSSWGGEDLVLALKRYSNVVKSTIQPHLYLVDPSQMDLEAHSVPLYEDELLATSGAQAVLQHRNRSSTNTGRTSILHQPLSPSASTSNSEALPSLDNLTFNVLNSFSRLTNRARHTAQNIAHPILSHPLSKPILKHLPPPIANLANANSPEYSKWAEKAGVAGYDAARVYLARWARTVAEEGERARRSEMLFTGQHGLSEDKDVDELGGPFEVLASTYRLPRPRSTRVQGVQPIVESEWRAWFDASTGKLMLGAGEAKKRIFQRGLVEGARREAWPFLLEVYPWDSTAEERTAIYNSKKEEYEALKGRWFGRKDVTSTEQFVEEHHRVQIDCLRTDRNQAMFSANASAPISGDRNLTEMYNAQMAASTINVALRGGDSGGQPPGNYHTHKLVEILLTYNVWETDLGYVQGMSDLCSPLYVVLEGDETLVFWSFVHLMEERMVRGLSPRVLDLR